MVIVRALPHPAADALRLDAVLHALADPVRLELVRRIAEAGETSCCADGLTVPKSTLSGHWRILREAGVTHTQVQGRSHLMSLRRADLDGRFPGLLDVILRVAPASL